MKVAALQIASIPLSESKLDYYFRICASKEVKLLLFGEYVFNLFFKELEKTPLDMIKEQTAHHLESLKQLAKEYQMTVVAPLVSVEKKQPYKMTVKIDPQGHLRTYCQQILMPYPHWNEAKFFANKQEGFQSVFTFKVDNVRFGVIAGFELHFDQFFMEFMEKKVDCILLSSVSTFDSTQRWRELVKSRAFTGNSYILRANRIGEYESDKISWKFYGDSQFVNPDGEVEEALMDKEELLIGTIDKNQLKESRAAWGFRRLAIGHS